MTKLTFWDKTSALTFPNGQTMSAEEVMASADFGFTKAGQALLATTRGITSELHSFGILCANYGISDELSDDEALAAINEAREAEQAAAESYISTEERTAAALEFLAMTSITEE